MDFRDALVCNKYILEAKRSGDYHQMARARVLETALASIDARKREQLEREAHKQATFVPGSEEYRQSTEDYKLQNLMAKDPEVAAMYQDHLYLIREDKEQDVNRINRVHDRFDYLKDEDKMRNKIKSA